MGGDCAVRSDSNSEATLSLNQKGSQDGNSILGAGGFAQLFKRENRMIKMSVVYGLERWRQVTAKACPHPSRLPLSYLCSG